ncbi:putative DNA modification/repair radical SAM protein [Desulfosporosinus sp. FKB]|uniref:putative DNA modification/repair radical SAM protein n=1 Tax=Desulfosporosinus sp. FKB TaxID=1969835 RepID=UPI000B498108|nr:putative DNA modification/repair radical SAM protein [Desulfosporosinus sp. FKB]
MDIYDKLMILSDSAKYDVACTSSGVDRRGKQGSIGSAANAGICHSFAADGRCISLLKVLMTNICIYDCKYCINRTSNDTKRTAFTPSELAELTVNFYRRNYIEGLFLSSGVIKSPNYTMEQMIKALTLLREVYHFNGYIHVKTIPGADSEFVTRLGLLADRMSVNIELPSQESLKLLAPNKTKDSILRPMGFISHKIQENGSDLVKFRHASKFVPAGQSTQLIVGATPDTDHKILILSEGLYKKYRLKRVFYSAYIPVAEHTLLPSVDTKPPLLREHRLYQADWLLRFYGFEANELLDEQTPNFNLQVDPKCNWAINHLEQFPIEINKAPYEMLLRVPGIGVTSAMRILTARRSSLIDFDGLKKMGVVLKRAQYFITCKGKVMNRLKIPSDSSLRTLMSDQPKLLTGFAEQLSFFPDPPMTREEVSQCLTEQR